MVERGREAQPRDEGEGGEVSGVFGESGVLVECGV